MSPSGILKKLVQLEKEFQKIQAGFPAKKWSANTLPEHHLSAVNLLQYLTLRKNNISHLQNDLHSLGLSSLASAESHIHRQIQEVMMRLGFSFKKKECNPCTTFLAKKKLAYQTQHLFGSIHPKNHVAIMVTLDSEMHLDKQTIEGFMKRGMQIARINCAHDTPDTWRKMIDLVRKAEKDSGLSCKIYMDLAGPKFRVHIFNNGKEQSKMDINIGDRFLLTDDADFIQQEGVTLFCQIPGIAGLLHKGNFVMMDDGIVEAIVTGTTMSGIELTITRISGKPQLKTGKGINFPNTAIPIASLTKEDIKSLEFIREHADLVGYSFVRHTEDLTELHKYLYSKKSSRLPYLIIKVETPESVQNLPYLLLYAMRYPFFGVMIARGDLAVEIGFERMSEIQEEILWICEAAHTPVIWATQVLEQLNKTGIASRSEITDAYKAAQAECIMINKGKYTHLVLDTLNDIAKRSHRHHLKKRYEMQSLGIAKKFSEKKIAL
ncbi:MAG: pyruvate kinase [Chitinophagaceae bacterium]|nr:pyruvate kinase [Chitinophagaceae bacterium]